MFILKKSEFHKVRSGKNMVYNIKEWPQKLGEAHRLMPGRLKKNKRKRKTFHKMLTEENEFAWFHEMIYPTSKNYGKSYTELTI